MINQQLCTKPGKVLSLRCHAPWPSGLSRGFLQRTLVVIRRQCPRENKRSSHLQVTVWLGIMVKQDRLLTERQERDKEQVKME